MKYIDEIWSTFISSSILLFSLSIIVYQFTPVNYIGNIDATILTKIALLLVLIFIITEIMVDFFDK